ncbi:hypothetical protein SAMN04488564_109150 [Lentzea waywayandensis]|uniref:Uncharacterized protein n=1 Tax=Lentzea waywayandensis TaxID=84724 RepID=A0A1I6F7M1_9PSEU|nr:hypothetical protein SAMN04488564_109150 [Lentzea waywayandensis]
METRPLVVPVFYTGGNRDEPSEAAFWLASGHDSIPKP